MLHVFCSSVTHLFWCHFCPKCDEDCTFTFEIKSTLTNAERNTNHRLDQLSQFVQVFLPKFDMYNHLVTAMDSFGQNRELALLYVE